MNRSEVRRVVLEVLGENLPDFPKKERQRVAEELVDRLALELEIIPDEEDYEDEGSGELDFGGD